MVEGEAKVCRPAASARAEADRLWAGVACWAEMVAMVVVVMEILEI
jgi:hypothetical protein